jgi:hypothetical protein
LERGAVGGAVGALPFGRLLIGRAVINELPIDGLDVKGAVVTRPASPRGGCSDSSNAALRVMSRRAAGSASKRKRGDPGCGCSARCPFVVCDWRVRRRNKVSGPHPADLKEEWPDERRELLRVLVIRRVRARSGGDIHAQPLAEPTGDLSEDGEAPCSLTSGRTGAESAASASSPGR